MSNNRRESSLKLVATLSLLSAIGIILGKFLAFNITEFMRFSLENLTILFSAAAFGPLAGLAVGLLQDIVGCLLRGYLLNPVITLGSGAVGLISGLLWRGLKSTPIAIRASVSVGLSHLVGSVFIKTLGLVIYYSLPFTATLLWRTFNYVIVGAIETVLLVYLLKSKLLLAQIDKIKPKTRKIKEEEK